MISFNNTEIAYSSHSTPALKRARLLFLAISFPVMVSIGEFLLRFAILLKIPIAWAIKPTIFRQFVGGETLEECIGSVNNLFKHGVNSILDYSIEAKDTEVEREMAFEEIHRSIIYASQNPAIAFSVFKPSGIANAKILEKVSNDILLNENEQNGYNLFVRRVDALCQAAFDNSIPILIDAEDSWYQAAIDNVAEQMMARFNKKKVIVYNTLQMYRTDRLDYLLASHKKALENEYSLGVKLVRGAYMEKERKRADEMEYTSPIQLTKDDTDRDFNQAIKHCIINIDSISLFCGSHNEESVAYCTMLMESNNLEPNDHRVFFSQLYGMSDNISFNLSSNRFNTAKYIPYGPVKEVLPYLIRRAQENRSVKGQTGRELLLIRQELNRRSKTKQ